MDAVPILGDVFKRGPAIVIDENTIVVLAMMVTSKDKKSTYSIKLEVNEAAYYAGGIKMV